MSWGSGVLTIGLFVAASAGAQSTVGGDARRAGPREILNRDREIALARSAAPPSVSDSATVFVLGAAGYSVAVKGTNGVACYVSRGWPKSIEPHCFDAEGAATLMPMEMRRVELYHRGVKPDSVERELAEGITSGRYRLPRRPVMSWMMSAAQNLISDEGQPAGAWKPHLMIYFPYMSAAEMGLAGPPDMRHAMLVDPGRATSNLMIPVAEFIKPAGASSK